MLTTLAALVALGMTDRSSEGMSLITAMEKKYQDSLTLSGTIVGGHSAGMGHIETLTDLKFVRPNMLYLSQIKRTNDPTTYQIKSDGTIFTYEAPLFNSKKRGGPLFEPVREPGGYLMNLGDMYFAGYRGLIDPNPALDVVLGVTNNINDWHKHLASVGAPKKYTLDGVACTLIQGNYRPTLGGVPDGWYEIYIGPDGLLKRYVQVESIHDVTKGMPIINANIAAVYDVVLSPAPNLSPKDFKNVVGK